MIDRWKMLDHSSEDAMQDIDKRSKIWRMVCVFNTGSICIHGKELLRQFALRQKYWERYHFKADVRHIWKVDIGTIRRDLWSEYNELGRFSMEVFIFGWWWRSHQSLEHKERFTYFQKLYYALERMNENPQSNYTSTRNLSSCFFLEGVKLAYAVTVSGAGRIIFQAVERLQFLTRVELLFFMIYSFPVVPFVMSTLIKKESFNHCGRSETWNSTHHGRYVFPSLRRCCVSVSSLFLYLSFSVSLLSLSLALSLCPCLRVVCDAVLCCVCRCGRGVCGEGVGGRRRGRREKGRDKSDHLVAGSLRSFPQDNWHLTA